MPQLKGLRLAIDLALRKRDAAAAALLQSRQGHAMALAQAEQLESYATETEARWALASRSTANPAIMGHYDQFMERLKQAVDMQRAVVAEHGRACEVARLHLLAEDVRLAGLKRLLDKRRANLAHVQAAREQKLLDDMAALQFRRLHQDRQTLETS